jgi:hypothetical protein
MHTEETKQKQQLLQKWQVSQKLGEEPARFAWMCEADPWEYALQVADREEIESFQEPEGSRLEVWLPHNRAFGLFVLFCSLPALIAGIVGIVLSAIALSHGNMTKGDIVGLMGSIMLVFICAILVGIALMILAHWKRRMQRWTELED